MEITGEAVLTVPPNPQQSATAYASLQVMPTRQTFRNRFAANSRYIGAILWVLCVQFFVAEQFVRNAWTTPYSWSANYISDLGAAYCTNRPVGYVCSPLHSVMNASFILQGVLITVGVALVSPLFPADRLGVAGIRFLGIAGPSLALVGLFPEDVNYRLHFAGAALHLVCAGIGMLLLGLSLLWKMPARRSIGMVSTVGGGIVLTANALLVSGHDMGLGVGGMERLGAYPLPLWLTLMGLFFFVRSRRTQDNAVY
jgi:hypothetical membrane protein